MKPRPNTLLATAALLMAATAVAGPADADSSTPGGGGYTAPAPTKVDRAGTDQDEYCIPDAGLGDLYTVYLVDGQYAAPLKCHPTNGATQVHITTEKDYGTWTFDYSTDPGPAAAPDAFSVNVGACLYDPVGETETPRAATVSMTNTPDAGGRYIRALRAGAYSERDFAYGAKTYVTRLEDGASFTAELFEWEAEGLIDRYSGLPSGKTWTFVVDRSDLRDHPDEPGARTYRVFEQNVFVPPCRMTQARLRTHSGHRHSPRLPRRTHRPEVPHPPAQQARPHHLPAGGCPRHRTDPDCHPEEVSPPQAHARQGHPAPHR